MTEYAIVACPACGSRAQDQIASAEELRAEVEALWAFHTRRLRARTPPEHLADRVAFSQRPPLRVARCTRCGMIFRDPAERGWVVAGTYADETPDRDVLRALHDTQRAAYRAQAERLTRIAERAGRVVEVGSYVGGFLAAARELGWNAEGVDVNATANAFAREQGLRVHDGELADAEVRDLDAVALWNCFDQLPDPRGTLAAARARLAPGGVLALRVPNGAFYAVWRARLHARVPALAALARELLAQNNLLSFPYRNGFTPDALTGMVERAGFRVAHLVGDVLVPIADRWTRPWARVEERVVKRALRLAARDARHAPWFELYALREAGV